MSKAEARVVKHETQEIDSKKVNREHLFRVLKELGVEINKKTPAALVAAYLTYTEVNSPKEPSDPCDNCHAVSDFAVFPTTCPVCGVGEDQGEEAKEETPKAKTESGIVLAKDDLVPASEVQTERELNEAVADFQRLQGDAIVSFWHLGVKLREIFEKKLWMLRREDGKARYKSVEAFTIAELNLTPQGAYNMVECAKAYTEDQARALGKTKAVILLRIPESARQGMLEKVLEKELKGKKVSKRELLAETSKIKKESGYKMPSHDEKGRGGSRPGKKDGPKAKSREEKITVASILGRVTLSMYRKPEGRSWAKDDLVPADKIGDEPVAIETMENGVEARYFVTKNDAGKLKLLIVRKRVEEV